MGSAGEGQARTLPARSRLRRHGAAVQGSESVPRLEDCLQAVRPLKALRCVLSDGILRGAMSRESVEIVKGAFEAWNAGDVDALRELYDPDTILRMPEGWPEPGPYFGREAIMRQWQQQRETWDADALEATSDFIDVADRVVVRFIWRGAGHGPESNLELTTIVTVRKGRIFYTEFFWDHAEALEASGLSEQAMSQERP
jgi:ketosteroid isomerase-like protein